MTECVGPRAVLTKIFQLTSITKNLNDAHELLTSMKTAAILYSITRYSVKAGRDTASQRHVKLAV